MWLWTFTATNQNVALKANFVKWQSAMARELLNANGISKSKALARFVPDALKQIEPFHFHSLPTVK